MKKLSRFTLGVAMASVMTACATTQGPTTYDFDEPRESVSVLLMPMDVEVKFAKVGSTDLRADWTELAEDNFEQTITSHLQSTGEKVVNFSAGEANSENVQQLILLQQHIAEAITSHVTFVDPTSFRGRLPHKEGENQLTYSLGPLATQLGGVGKADYAAFLTNRTTIESGGSVFAKIAIGAITGYTPALSSFKGTYLTLVDLKTGDVVWLKTALGSALSGDPRDSGYTDQVITNLLGEGPFTDDVEAES